MGLPGCQGPHRRVRLSLPLVGKLRREIGAEREPAPRPPAPLPSLLPPPRRSCSPDSGGHHGGSMQPGPRRGPNICPPSLGFLTCQVEAIRVSTSQAGVRTMNENTERLAQGAAQTKCPSVGSHHPLSIAPLISCEEGLQLAELRPGAQWLVVGGERVGQPIRAQMGLHSGPHSSFLPFRLLGMLQKPGRNWVAGRALTGAPPLAGPFRVLGAPHPHKKGGEAEGEAATSADPDALGAEGPGACVSARKKDGESSAAQRPGRGKKGCHSRVGAPDCHRCPGRGQAHRDRGLEGAGTTAEQEEAREGTGHQDRHLPETGTWGGRPQGWPRPPARAHG